MIGVIVPDAAAGEGEEAFIRGLAEYGYVEGENVSYVRRENSEDIESAFMKMTEKNVDLIYAETTPVAVKLKQLSAGADIPVVFVVYDPVGSGLVKSLIHPGGNLTGIQLPGSTPKTLERLLEIAPDAKHIFIPVKFDTWASLQSLKYLKQGAEIYGLKLAISEVTSAAELDKALSSMPDDLGAIFLIHSILINANAGSIAEKAIKEKVPLVSSVHGHYRKGAVMSCGPGRRPAGLQAARLAHNILQGIPPGDLPVENAGYYLGFNLKTAKAIGINISNDILLQADDIIR